MKLPALLLTCLLLASCNKPADPAAESSPDAPPAGPPPAFIGSWLVVSGLTEEDGEDGQLSAEFTADGHYRSIYGSGTYVATQSGRWQQAGEGRISITDVELYSGSPLAPESTRQPIDREDFDVRWSMDGEILCLTTGQTDSTEPETFRLRRRETQE